MKLGVIILTVVTVACGVDARRAGVALRPMRRVLTAEQQRRRGTSEAMTDVFVSSYSATIRMDGNQGSPSVLSVDLLLDTGSSDTGVAGPNIAASPIRYTPTTPPIANSLTQISYGDGSVYMSGYLYDIQVYFGSVQFKDDVLIMSSQNGMIQKGPSGTNLTTSGILGLGYASLATVGSLPFFDSMVRTLAVPNVFAFQACPSDVKTVDSLIGPGNLWLGGYSTAYFANSSVVPQWIYLSQENFYTVNMPQMSVLGSSFTTQSSLTIVDTGTTNLVLNPTLYQNFKSTLLAQNFGPEALFVSRDYPYCVRISRPAHEWPTVTFTFDNAVELSVPASQYLFECGNPFYYALYIVESPIDRTTLGLISLIGSVTLFDRVRNRVAFVPTDLSMCDVPDTAVVPYPPQPYNNLQDLCAFPDGQPFSCALTCSECTAMGSSAAWCSQGTATVTTSDGVTTVLGNTDKGFCWTGGYLKLTHTTVRPHLPHYGQATVSVSCSSSYPQYHQCSTSGLAIIVLISLGIALGVLFLLLLCLVCFRARQRKADRAQFADYDEPSTAANLAQRRSSYSSVSKTGVPLLAVSSDSPYSDFPESLS